MSEQKQNSVEDLKTKVLGMMDDVMENTENVAAKRKELREKFKEFEGFYDTKKSQEAQDSPADQFDELKNEMDVDVKNYRDLELDKLNEMIGKWNQKTGELKAYVESRPKKPSSTFQGSVVSVTVQPSGIPPQSPTIPTPPATPSQTPPTTTPPPIPPQVPPAIPAEPKIEDTQEDKGRAVAILNEIKGKTDELRGVGATDELKKTRDKLVSRFFRLEKSFSMRIERGEGAEEISEKAKEFLEKDLKPTIMVFAKMWELYLGSYSTFDSSLRSIGREYQLLENKLVRYPENRDVIAEVIAGCDVEMEKLKNLKAERDEKKAKKDRAKKLKEELEKTRDAVAQEEYITMQKTNILQKIFTTPSSRRKHLHKTSDDLALEQKEELYKKQTQAYVREMIELGAIKEEDVSAVLMKERLDRVSSEIKEERKGVKSSWMKSVGGWFREKTNNLANMFRKIPFPMRVPCGAAMAGAAAFMLPAAAGAVTLGIMAKYFSEDLYRWLSEKGLERRIKKELKKAGNDRAGRMQVLLNEAGKINERVARDKNVRYFAKMKGFLTAFGFYSHATAPDVLVNPPHNLRPHASISDFPSAHPVEGAHLSPVEPPYSFQHAPGTTGPEDVMFEGDSEIISNPAGLNPEGGQVHMSPEEINAAIMNLDERDVESMRRIMFSNDHELWTRLKGMTVAEAMNESNGITRCFIAMNQKFPEMVNNVQWHMTVEEWTKMLGIKGSNMGNNPAIIRTLKEVMGK